VYTVLPCPFLSLERSQVVATPNTRVVEEMSLHDQTSYTRSESVAERTDHFYSFVQEQSSNSANSVSTCEISGPRSGKYEI
jgi:hypothetical protein